MKIIKHVNCLIKILLFLLIVIPVTCEAKVIPGDGNDYYEEKAMYAQGINLENSTIYYQLDYSNVTHASLSPTNLHLSFPNVFLKEKEGGKVVNTLDGAGNEMRPAATGFMIAEKDDSNSQGYKVMNNPFSLARGNIYRSRKQTGIYGQRNDVFMPSSKKEVTVGTEIVSVGNTIARHTFTVDNTSDEDITFILMKDMGVNLKSSGMASETATMKMLGVNEGISIEQNGYRLNYLFRNTVNGPDNFTSFGLPWNYISPTGYLSPIDNDHYANNPWLYRPYDNNSIHGTGMEADGYQPNEVLVPNKYSDERKSGITMKWDEVTLKPGEFKDFTYDVQIYGDFGITYLFHNLDREKKDLYSPGDYVDFQPAGNWNKEDYRLSEGTIETSISEYITLNPNDEVIVKAIDTSGNRLNTEEIKKVKINEVYNEETRLLEVPISKKDMSSINLDPNSVVLDFKGQLNESSRNKEVIQTAKVRFKDSKDEKEYYREQPIQFKVEDTEWVVPVSYGLSVDKSVDKTEAYLNEMVSYSVRVTNEDESTSVLNNAQVVDQMPNGLSKPTDVVINNQVLSDKEYEWDETTRQLAINLGDMAPSEVKDISYQAKLLSGNNEEVKLNHVSFTGSNDEAIGVNSIAEFKVKIKEKRAVTFDSNGGSQVPTQEVDDGDKANEPKQPMFLNREFIGWYEDPELTDKYDFNQEVQKNLTLYAKWRSCILDPVDHDKPAIPENINETTNDLRIAYVSDFDFGEAKNSKDELQVKARADTLKNDANKKVPSFISVIDDRSMSETNNYTWTLRAKSSKFTDKQNNELKGARLNLSDLNYAGKEKNPNLTSGSINITDSVQKLSSSENQPVGSSWSLAFGQLKNDSVSGVTLDIPNGAYKNPTNYKAVIDWQLVPEIKD